MARKRLGEILIEAGLLDEPKLNVALREQQRWGGPLGRKLRRLGLGVRLFYGRHHRIAFRLAAASPRARAIGLRWYNGVDGWDERRVLPALATLVGRRPL